MARSRGDERAWIRGAQSGSVSDLEALFRHHWPRAYRAAYLVVHDSAAAEDIAQEAFLAAVRGLDRFDRRRPFGPWLHRIVVNRAIDWTRARALRREAGAAPVGDPPAPERTPSDGTFVALLATLSPEHRAVIVLRYLLEYTPGEISELLDLPRGAVLHSLRKAIGVQHAQPALFRLPAPGRLLVQSVEGPWVVQPDGSKRLLGPYLEAAWSPHGLFVAVTKPDELAAVEPSGSV